LAGIFDAPGGDRENSETKRDFKDFRDFKDYWDERGERREETYLPSRGLGSGY
jgi:hypothetical protein